MDAKLSNDNNECIAKNKWLLTISEKKYRFSKVVCNLQQEYHKLMETLKKLFFFDDKKKKKCAILITNYLACKFR